MDLRFLLDEVMVEVRLFVFFGGGGGRRQG
jgi:hypothetical protein